MDNGHQNTRYMSLKTFDNDSVLKRKSKITLKLNKPGFVAMCILDLSKVLMYEFQYVYTLIVNMVTVQDYY